MRAGARADVESGPRAAAEWLSALGERLRPLQPAPRGARQVRALHRTLARARPETAEHSDRVARLAVRFGRRLGLPAAQLRLLTWGAALHDLGKLAVDPEVLDKPGALTPAERARMRLHVTLGEGLVRRRGQLPEEVVQIVRWHHERWDGAGYPAGLRGAAIPRLVRIFAICDVYDALTHARAYKPAWPSSQALRELECMAGRQLDPTLVAAFVAMMAPPTQAPGHWSALAMSGD